MINTTNILGAKRTYDQMHQGHHAKYNTDNQRHEKIFSQTRRPEHRNSIDESHPFDQMLLHEKHFHNLSENSGPLSPKNFLSTKSPQKKFTKQASHISGGEQSLNREQNFRIYKVRLYIHLIYFI